MYAVRLNLPIYWVADTNGNKAIDPDEIVALDFYPTPSIALADAYAKVVAESKAPPATDCPDRARRARPRRGPAYARAHRHAGMSGEDRELVAHMLEIAHHVDKIYETQDGAAALASQLPTDAASQSLFRRNRGPKCVMPDTENDPQCSAIPGAPKPAVDAYPAPMQKSERSCKDLEARPDAKALLAPFTVVRDDGGKLAALPDSVAYKDEMTAVAGELAAAATAMKDPGEVPLVTYLRAAAGSFRDNNWLPADEAWAKMSVDTSKWYVRVGPDETYWDAVLAQGRLSPDVREIDQGSKRGRRSSCRCSRTWRPRSRRAPAHRMPRAR